MIYKNAAKQPNLHLVSNAKQSVKTLHASWCFWQCLPESTSCPKFRLAPWMPKRL